MAEDPREIADARVDFESSGGCGGSGGEERRDGRGLRYWAVPGAAASAGGRAAALTGARASPGRGRRAGAPGRRRRGAWRGSWRRPGAW